MPLDSYFLKAPSLVEHGCTSSDFNEPSFGCCASTCQAPAKKRAHALQSKQLMRHGMK